MAMEAELQQRPQWEVDKMLTGFIGEDVRVAAKAFSPVRWNRSERPPHLIPVRDLFLPDNAQPEGLPVFFEGRLQRFERQIGIVYVWLDARTAPETATDGLVYFRAKTAVILRGPAVVELAFPFQVERLPSEPGNYWRDVRAPRAQFEFPFLPEAGTGEGNSLSTSSAVGSHATAAAPALVVDGDPQERRLPPIDSRAPSEVDRSSRDDTVKGDRCLPQPGPKEIPIRNLNCSPSTH